MNWRIGTWLFVLVVLFSVSAWADSQARIVRLSDVDGDVQIDRATGDGYEKAFLNMPVTEGVRLRTLEDGRAEVEFEDGSTIHLAPGSILQFAELSLRSSGAKISTIEIQQGQAYLNFVGKRPDEFKLTFNQQTATLDRPAHLRLKLDNTSASLAVFKGGVRVDGPAGGVDVGSKHTATFDFSSNGQFELARNIAEDEFDSWDKEQTEYHQRYLASNSYDTPYNYGVSDLNYYGRYYDIPGYGMCWRPYFTGMGWDPFMDGAWMWYPGFGYTWVSAYPWGWIPYHYGSWQFIPGWGWTWRPGYTWVAWNGLPPVLNPPRLYVPPRPPVIPHNTVIVGRGPSRSLVSSGASPGSKIVIKGDSAGMGVPRGMHNLPRMHNEFEAKGAVTMPAVAGRPTPATPSSTRPAIAVSPNPHATSPNPGAAEPNPHATAPNAPASPSPAVVSPRPAPAAPRATTPSVPHSSSPPRMSTPRSEGGFSGGRTSSPPPRSNPSHSNSSPHK